MNGHSLYAPTAEEADLALAVIIPCHNVESTIGAQLDALVVQRWRKPWGIVVVDNGSTDGTAAVAQLYEERGVRILSATDRAGASYARNAGVRSVRSSSLAFCDGDDVVAAGWVEAMGESLEHHEMVSGQLETQTLNPPWLAGARPMGRPGSLPKFGRLGFASGCNFGMQRSLFERLDGFDETFVGNEDIEISLRALAEGARIEMLNAALVSYRFRDSVGAVWRQGIYYGLGRPSLIRQAKRLGLPGPNRFDGWRSWVWLAARLPTLADRAGRIQWVWVAGNRVGVLLGSKRIGKFYV